MEYIVNALVEEFVSDGGDPADWLTSCPAAGYCEWRTPTSMRFPYSAMPEPTEAANTPGEESEAINGREFFTHGSLNAGQQHQSQALGPGRRQARGKLGGGTKEKAGKQVEGMHFHIRSMRGT